MVPCLVQSRPGCGVSVLVVLRHQRKPGPGIVRLTLLWPGSSLESGVPVGREPSNRHHQPSLSCRLERQGQNTDRQVVLVRPQTSTTAQGERAVVRELTRERSADHTKLVKVVKVLK